MQYGEMSGGHKIISFVVCFLFVLFLEEKVIRHLLSDMLNLRC